ncbi:MAG: energy transducer TonB [Planctomycetes bacterium]|nr:energy transducer TonB [Planctomycetota bacterium]
MTRLPSVLLSLACHAVLAGAAAWAVGGPALQDRVVLAIQRVAAAEASPEAAPPVERPEPPVSESRPEPLEPRFEPPPEAELPEPALAEPTPVAEAEPCAAHSLRDPERVPFDARVWLQPVQTVREVAAVPAAAATPAAAESASSEAVLENPDNRPPRYPPAAQRRERPNPDGSPVVRTVILRVAISAAGTIESCEVEVPSGNPILDDEARRALRTWRITPARRDGMPVASVVRVPVEFRLHFNR